MNMPSLTCMGGYNICKVRSFLARGDSGALGPELQIVLIIRAFDEMADNM